MPVETVRLEKQIYLSQWSERIDVVALSAGQELGNALMREYGEDELPYILICDLTAMQSFDANVQGYRELFKKTPRMLSTLVVHAPASLKFVGETFVRINPNYALEFYNLLDEALIRARMILANPNEIWRRH